MWPYNPGKYMNKKIQEQSSFQASSKKIEEEFSIEIPDQNEPAGYSANVVFESVGAKVRGRCVTQIIISLILVSIFYGAFWLGNQDSAPFGKAHLQFATFHSFNVIFYVLPLALFGFFSQQYAVLKKKPTCSCDKIKRAYRLTLESFPVEYRAVKDPYRSSSFIIKHLHALRQYLFWSYMVNAAIFLALYFFKDLRLETFFSWYNYVFGATNYLPYFIVVYVLVLSSIILVWDKRSPNFMNESVRSQNGGTFGYLILLCLMGFVFFVFEDEDCAAELDKFEYEP